MYISGILKKKTISFYRPSILHFDIEGINIKIGKFLYDGHLIMLPWEQNLETTLIRKQEQLIQKEMEISSTLTKEKFPGLKKKVDQLLQQILTTHRKYTMALLEMFYTIIVQSPSLEEILVKVNKLEIFINWIEKEDINQIDLDILLELFLNNRPYDKKSLHEAKLKKFHIIEDDLLSESLKEILIFGEFISPNRVPKIANSLQDIESSQLVLPIYFAISNDIDANNFLKLCRTTSLEEKQVKRNATRMRIPPNIQNLIR